MTEGYDGECPDNLMKKAFVDFCESYLVVADAYLGEVKSASDESNCNKAFYGMLGYVVLNRYLQATRPKYSDIADHEYYAADIQKVISHCERIKRAGYYGSSSIQKSVDAILSM